MGNSEPRYPRSDDEIDFESSARTQIERSAFDDRSRLVDPQGVGRNVTDFAVIFRDVDGTTGAPNSPRIGQLIKSFIFHRSEPLRHVVPPLSFRRMQSPEPQKYEFDIHNIHQLHTTLHYVFLHHSMQGDFRARRCSARECPNHERVAAHGSRTASVNRNFLPLASRGSVTKPRSFRRFPKAPGSIVESSPRPFKSACAMFESSET